MNEDWTEPKPLRPNAVAGIAVVCLCVVAMTAIIGAVKFAHCPPCPICPEAVIKTFVDPEAFGEVIPQRKANE